MNAHTGTRWWTYSVPHAPDCTIKQIRKSNNLFIRLYTTTVMQYSLIALDIDNTPQDKQILSYFHGKHRQGDLNI